MFFHIICSDHMKQDIIVDTSGNNKTSNIIMRVIILYLGHQIEEFGGVCARQMQAYILQFVWVFDGPSFPKLFFEWVSKGGIQSQVTTDINAQSLTNEVQDGYVQDDAEAFAAVVAKTKWQLFSIVKTVKTVKSV